MKMMAMKMSFLLSGMSILGMMYIKKHPEAINKMKDMGKDAARRVYQFLDH